MAEDGQPRQVRLSARVLSGRMRRLRESLKGAAVLRKVRALHEETDAAERAAVVGEIEELKRVLGEIARALRG